MNLDKILVFALTGIQACLYFALVFWFFFLIWKTFPFRYGLLGNLMKEVPILFATPICIILYFVEKALRIVSNNIF